MKKRILGAALLLLGISAAAFATITLNSSAVQTYQVGAATVETDSIASATRAEMDFGAKTVTVTVQFGTSGTNGFASGSRQQPLVVTINAGSGQIAVSDSRTNIKLTSAQQTAVQSLLTNFQNQIETFLVNNGIVPGTAVAN